jgi:hypothetical protein
LFRADEEPLRRTRLLYGIGLSLNTRPGETYRQNILEILRGFVGANRVLKPGILAENIRDGIVNDFAVVLVEPVVEELAGYLNRESSTVKLLWHNGLEPGLEALRVYALSDLIETGRPHAFSLFLLGRLRDGCVTVSDGQG